MGVVERIIIIEVVSLIISLRGCFIRFVSCCRLGITTPCVIFIDFKDELKDFDSYLNF